MRYRALAVVLGLACAGPALAEGPDDVAARFGARVSIQGASLSPDGTKLAMIVPMGDGQRLEIADLVAGGVPRPILGDPRSDQRLVSCRWVTDSRLFCQVRIEADDVGTLVSYSRMIAINADGTNAKVVIARSTERTLYFGANGGGVIDWTGPKPGQVLMTRQYVPEITTGTRLASDAEGLGVDAIDVNTLDRSQAEPPRPAAAEYLTDGLGHVRIMGLERQNSTNYATGKYDYYYRKKDARGWLPLAHMDGSEAQRVAGFEPVAVDPAQDVVYGFDSTDDGFKQLVSIRLDGSGTRAAVLTRHDVDVDELVTIGRQRRVIGASYATERRTIEYSDAALGRLDVALGKALPNHPGISFIDASADESRLLLVAGSDTDPGTLYRFDKATHHLEQILSLRPELEGMTLAQMEPISFPAADGTMIPGYLTLPPTGPRKGIPAIVMPHGGPSDRDQWGFDWLVQYFAARGYAVLQPNYRGSAGYGAGWFQHNGFQSWRTAIGDIDDGGRWLVAQGIAAPGKLAIVGWSYGGYAALQSGVTEPGLFKAIVAVAPVTDLENLRAQAMHYSNGALVDKMIGNGDHVRSGSPARHAEAFAAPVLLFHGTRDLNVAVDQSRDMADRLRKAAKPVDYVEFKGLNHQLDSAAARSELLSRSDAFLRKALGL